jgi:hypothetical protein
LSARYTPSNDVKEVAMMPDYKAMYVKLFQSQTKAIGILQDAQKETENMYIEAESPDIRVLKTPDASETPEPPPEKE